MTKFIQLTQVGNEQPVYVNPDNIVSVYDNEDRAVLYLNNRAELRVLESRATVLALAAGEAVVPAVEKVVVKPVHPASKRETKGSE